MSQPTIERSRLSGYGFNPVAGRYVDGRGRFVSFAVVRAELERVVEASAAQMRALSGQLVARQIGLAEWQLGMGREIKILHAAAAAAGRGGWAQMSPADWGWVGRRVRDQYAYLQRFALQIEAGSQKLNGQFGVRVTQYARAGRSTYEDMRLRSERGQGKREGRRLLHARESCPGCFEEAARSWVPIESMAPIGVFACRHNCRCTFEFR